MIKKVNRCMILTDADDYEKLQSKNKKNACSLCKYTLIFGGCERRSCKDYIAVLNSFMARSLFGCLLSLSIIQEVYPA